MHVRLIAVGDRQPSWVDSAFSEYAARLPRQWRFRVDAIKAAPRGGNGDAAKNEEGEKILSRLKSNEYAVLLDERGSQFTSRALSEQLADWLQSGVDLTFIIGGPDGVSGEVVSRADATWALSDLTLPHGLARVLFVEQIYRAWTLTTGHPYHRD